MLGLSKPTASNISTTSSDTTAELMICRMANSRSSSIRFLLLMSRLVRITLTAWKNATSSLPALASSNVQHRVNPVIEGERYSIVFFYSINKKLNKTLL